MNFGEPRDVSSRLPGGLSHAVLVRIAVALDDVAPEPVTVSALPHGIRIVASPSGRREVEAYWHPGADAVASFAVDVMDALQDEVIEEVLQNGWPPSDPDRPTDPQRGRELPGPHAEIVGRELRWWYGNRDRPALALPPIDVVATPSNRA